MMSVKQITDYITQIVREKNGFICENDLEKFCEKCYPNIILTDGYGSRGKYFDSLQILHCFNTELKFKSAYERGDFLKKIRRSITAHNINIANTRLNKIKELEQTLKKKEIIISKCKEDLLLDIILNKNPEKFLFDLVFKYDKDKKYKQKIQILEYMLEKDIDISLAFIEIITHYLLIERDYEKCKTYCLQAINIGNIQSLFLMSLNEYEEDNLDQMKQYFILFADKFDGSSIIYKSGLTNVISCFITMEIDNEIDKDYHQNLNSIQKVLSKISCKETRISIIHIIYCSIDDEINYIEQYQIFKEICLPNEIPKDVLNDYNVIKYINKCNLMSKNSECCICLNDNIVCIPLECCHYFCTKCYPKILNLGSCPNCRCLI